MSGDVTLLDTPDGSVARLVLAAEEAFGRPELTTAALVGGLAVTARIATVHRVTVDVDAVVEDTTRNELAVTSPEGPAGGERIVLAGVMVDVMPTSALPAHADGLPDDDLPRLFVLGHRWALESATRLAIRVEGSHEAEAELRVATAPALLACKLHAIADRRDSRADKRESDALDIVRLTQLLVRSRLVDDAYSSAPFDLAPLVVSSVRRWLVDDATRTARLVNSDARSSGVSSSPDELVALGELFCDQLRVG